MSLEPKDVRAKLSPELHEALVVLAETDGLDIGAFVARELVRVIKQRLHEATVIADRTRHLVISGKGGEKA